MVFNNDFVQLFLFVLARFSDVDAFTMTWILIPQTHGLTTQSNHYIKQNRLLHKILSHLELAL